MSECLNHETKTELEQAKVCQDEKIGDTVYLYFRKKERKCKNYYLFVLPKIKFKPIKVATETEGILKSVENLYKFYNEIDCNLLSNDMTMQIIKDFIYSLKILNYDEISYIRFEDLILKLAKEKETKDIINKYFDIDNDNKL